MNAQIPVLEVRDLVKHYSVGGGFFGRGRKQLRAVDGVSFSIGQGETLGLVGESGCGKSTVGKAVLRLVEPTSGQVTLEGEEITGLGSAALLDRRKRMQVIFQDPYSSLNPRMTAGEIVQEPLINFGIGNYAPTLAMLSLMGLDPRLCFPIMAASASFAAAGIATHHIKAAKIDLQIPLAMVLAGIPAVLVAAFIVKELPLAPLKWLVSVVISYTGIVMLRSAAIGRRAEAENATAPPAAT